MECWAGLERSWPRGCSCLGDDVAGLLPAGEGWCIEDFGLVDEPGSSGVADGRPPAGGATDPWLAGLSMPGCVVSGAVALRPPRSGLARFSEAVSMTGLKLVRCDDPLASLSFM